MKQSFRRVIFTTFLLNIGFILFSQQAETDPYVPKVIPPSPTAASLMKFGDIPVSYYTGSASVSVPVYTINCGDITVPVSLAYNTSGIRLSEEASWVGLGWALSAGGMISRTIMDKDDFGGNYFTTTVPEIDATPANHFDAVNPLHPSQQWATIQLNPYLYDFWCNYKVQTSGGVRDFYESLNGPWAYDFESDVFSFNFSGHSGKFIIKRNKQVIIQNQENLKISFDDPGYNFTITDDKGFKYVFSDLEWTQQSGSSTLYVSSWNLTKIISPRGFSVQFNYKNESTWTTTAGSISQTYRDGCSVSSGLTSIASQSNLYKNITLESIDFLNGKVHFYFDNNRIDYPNGKRLNKITVFRKPTSTDSSEIYSNEFYYSYFNDSYTGTASEFKRLRLDSVKKTSATEQLPPHKFSYYDDPFETTSLTGKSSFSIDHWGYYNGEANSVLYPAFWGYFNPVLGTTSSQMPPSWWDLPGANRNPHLTKQKLFSLKSVSYPTGGKSEFELEANDYDETKSFTGQTDFAELNYFDSSYSTIVSTRGTINGAIDLNRKYGPSTWVTIAFRCSNAAAATNLHNNNGQIYVQIFGNTIDISSASLTLSGNTVWVTGQVAYNVPTLGTYNWSTYISPSIGTDQFQDITITVQWKELRRLTKGFITGGGLRVKSITDYDYTGVVVKKRKFDYHYFEDKNGDNVAEEYSYGKRISHPSYIRYELLKGAETGCMSLTRFSSGNISLTGSTSGNAIGYDQVTELTVDPSNEANTPGKTVYTYYNASDTILNYIQMRLPGMNNIGSSKNGMLKSKIDYRVSGGITYKVSELQNVYSVANRKFNYALKYDNISQGTVGSGCIPAATLSYEYFGYIYPTIQSEKILLDSTIQITYENTDETNFVKTVSKNTYAPSTYLQLSRTEIENSRAEIQTTDYTYPYDYTGVVFDSLMNRNMISTVITQKSYTDNVLMNQVKTNYRLWQNNSLVLPDTISTATLTNPLEPVITFNTYDAKGNTQQYAAKNGVDNSFIYDYQSSFPIAQVTGSVLSGIAYTSFEADGNGSWTFSSTPINDATSPTGKRAYSFNGSNNITRTGLSSSISYIVSYWTKNASAFAIAGTQSGYPVQGRSINGWNLFTHKISGQTQVTIGSNGLIDELRLYPENALMTTMTYDPLVGITTQCDANNRITYYEYDSFSRLKLIRDQDGNIIKTIEYHYKQQ